MPKPRGATLTEIYPSLQFKHTTGMTHLRIMKSDCNFPDLWQCM